MKRLKLVLKLFLIALLAVLVFAQTNVGNLDLSDVETAQKVIEIDNNHIRYDQVGQGKDILFIHGTPGSLEDWNVIADSLSELFRITSFDRLGHGYSSCQDYNFSIAENAKVVEKIIEKLKLEKPMIIGHSYGGSVVAHLVSNHYNDELTYVIIDSPLYDYEPKSIYKLLTIPFLGKGLGFIANYTIAPGQISEGIESSLVNQSEEELKKITDERKELWLQPKVLNSKAHESVNYQENLDAISNNYKNISSRIIIVSGTDRDNTFRNEAERFAQEVLTDSLIILEETGHYIQFDQSEMLIEIVKNQLR